MTSFRDAKSASFKPLERGIKRISVWVASVLFSAVVCGVFEIVVIRMDVEFEAVFERTINNIYTMQLY